MWWQSTPLKEIVAATIPGLPEQIFPAPCYTLGCPAQTQKPADLKPDPLSLSSLDVILCQNRTSVHRGKCGDSSVKPWVSLEFPQASKEILDH